MWGYPWGLRYVVAEDIPSQSHFLRMAFSDLPRVLAISRIAVLSLTSSRSFSVSLAVQRTCAFLALGFLRELGFMRKEIRVLCLSVASKLKLWFGYVCYPFFLLGRQAVLKSINQSANFGKAGLSPTSRRVGGLEGCAVADG